MGTLDGDHDDSYHSDGEMYNRREFDRVDEGGTGNELVGDICVDIFGDGSESGCSGPERTRT